MTDPLARAARAAALAAVLMATSAHAQTAPAPAAPPAAEPRIAAGPLSFSPDVTLKLIDMLVSNGQLTRAQADELVADASRPRASGDTPAQAEARTALRDEENAIVVPYIPESVRRQLKAELAQEVTAQAKAEGWAAPGQVAPWTKRVTLYGDVRLRSEYVAFGEGNATLLPNFAAINAGSGFNINNNPASLFVNPPFLNTTQDRQRTRIRARVGLRAQVADWVTLEGRLATGSDSSPVSTNQTLGGNGNFSKYAVWLDRANIALTPLPNLTFELGRFANPFWTDDLLFDNDLNFDGVAARYVLPIDQGLSAFIAGGAFPVYNTDFNFGSNSSIKTASRDKYLAAVNAGVDWQASEDVKFRGGVGYYHFVNLEGERSSPCFPPPTAADSCDTDGSRPQFQQFGNTLFTLRDIQPGDLSIPELQYFGLASKYQILNVRGQASLALFQRFKLTADGEFVRNLGFDRADIENRFLLANANPDDDLVVNNRGEVAADGTSPYVGGATGWSAGLTFGTREMEQFGDFSAAFGYKYLETDAVVDGFTDSDFHLGGTNAKGFVVNGTAAIAPGTSLALRWFSADTIVGPRYSNDVVFLDLVAGF